MLKNLLKRFRGSARESQEIDSPAAAAQDYLLNGKPLKAIPILENILQGEPHNAEALNLLGRALFQANRPTEAKIKIEQAIALDVCGAGYYCNLAEVLSSIGDKTGAESAYNAQIKRTPKFEQGYIAMAKFLAAAGKGADVIKVLQKGQDAIPESDSICLLLAYYRDYEKGDFRGMLRTLEPIFKRNPHHTQAQLYAARAYTALADYSNCERLLRDIAKREPDNVDALIGLGQLMLTIVRGDEGEAYLRLALGIDPDNMAAAELLIALLIETNQLDRASDLLAVFSHQYPDNAGFCCHLGRLKWLSGEFESGKLNMRRALQIDPEYIPAIEYLANMDLKTGHLDAALAGYKKALAIDPQRPLTHYNYGLALLTAGNFKQGLAHYESRLQLAFSEGTPFKLRSIFYSQLQTTKDIPTWNGKSAIKGKRLLICGEQGLGDQIMMMRFLPQLRRLQPLTIHLIVNREVEALAQAMGILDGTIPADEWSVEKSSLYDLKCSSMSLPYLLKTNLQEVGKTIPYFKVSEDRTLRMQEVFASVTQPAVSALKVGLVWAGNPSLADDKFRSIPLAQLKPLFDVPHIQWVSLQKGAMQADISDGKWPLLDVMDHCKDFADTAALMDMLDLIIAVDTSVVHLAGAIGKQVWLFNRAGSEWRWMRNREDSPWYPTMRIFNQGENESWAPVIQRMVEALGQISLTREHT